MVIRSPPYGQNTESWMSIKLLVADPHEVFCAGLQEFVAGTEIQIVANLTDGQPVLDGVAQHDPQVVLLAVQLAQEDGLTVLEQLREQRPEVAVLVTACCDNPVQLARAHATGAAGFLLKDFDRQRLLETVRAAAVGQRIWTREDLRRVTGVQTTQRLDGPCDAPLTPREGEVLRQMTLGHTNRQIAEGLGISYETVKEHVQHILTKLSVEDRTQAAVWAVRHGLA